MKQFGFLYNLWKDQQMQSEYWYKRLYDWKIGIRGSDNQNFTHLWLSYPFILLFLKPFLGEKKL